ncbi:hypothetical protein Nepgr_005878 [Nepenthes gracilis]|uniref:EF-hand domain-containing protein n=1 Tax=Nepenthes gracilis TaxID=150966 RepID=A0AAD3S400_NEPGR|nr:hypothetical protein Nepgr_005878 [Nepenthes gracilis]
MAGGDSSLSMKNWFRRTLQGVTPKSAEGVPLSEDQLRRIFMEHDKNGDGSLNKEELQAAFRALGSRAPAWRADDAIYNNDFDLDGVLNKYEIVHLLSYTLQCHYVLG